jgi:HD-like signal output (HDOD) protein/CheY-like chemotaxis protein
MRKRLIFVDSDCNVLEGLEQMLSPLKDEWEMEFVGDPNEALERMAEGTFDAIVTEMKLDGMGGLDLLEQVSKKQPRTIRLVLSDEADENEAVKISATAHQYLSKPSDSLALRSVLQRALALSGLLNNESLQKLASRLDSLPSLPPVYLKVMDELQSPNSSLQKIGKLISEDIGMTAKILQLVNSAFFGVRRRVESPAQAASLLGIDNIRGMMLGVHVFSEFKDGPPNFSADALWSHSISVGGFAKRIAEMETGDLKIISDSLTAGMLHDSGKLVLATNLPEDYSIAISRSESGEMTAEAAERSIFKASHSHIGAYLMGLWGFNQPVVEALAFHHKPEEFMADTFTPLIAVHAANAIDHHLRKRSMTEKSVDMNRTYLEKLGFAERIPAWVMACREIADGERAEKEEGCEVPA